FNPSELIITMNESIKSYVVWLALSFCHPPIALSMALALQGGRWKRAFAISAGGAFAASYATSIASWLYKGMPTFGPSVVAVDLVVAALVMVAASVRRQRRGAGYISRRILWSTSGIVGAISLALLFLAFFDNPWWANHLVGLMFFAGLGAWLYCELRRSGQHRNI
ncbi:MAG: hypothetical protein ACP5UD_09235, partial [Conexivisphaera sp.]